MNINAVRWAFDQRTGDSYAKAVLVELAALSDEFGIRVCSLEDIACSTDIGLRTVQREIRLLEDARIIEARKISGLIWEFRLNLNRSTKSDEGPVRSLRSGVMIIRSKLQGRFAIVPNAIFDDERLSIEAKALLAYLLSLPGTWEVRHDQLQRKLGIGRKLLGRCFRELISVGYVFRDEKQGRDNQNRFTTLNYVVRNVPEQPGSDAPAPQAQKPQRARNTGNNKEDIKTNFNNTSSKSPPMERVESKGAQQVVYFDFGQRALAAGNSPVFVGSKPYEAWCNFRGSVDAMPGFVDRALISGRMKEVVWMPSVYPPRRPPREPEEGGGGEKSGG